MEKYKNKYIFKKQRDLNGKISENKDDNFLCCRGGAVIYRYNNEILAYESSSRIRLKKVNKETNEVEFDYTDLVLDEGKFKPYMSDGEYTLYFLEENLDKLAKLFKLREKRIMSEEQKEALVERLSKTRNVV